MGVKKTLETIFKIIPTHIIFLLCILELFYMSHVRLPSTDAAFLRNKDWLKRNYDFKDITEQEIIPVVKVFQKIIRIFRLEQKSDVRQLKQLIKQLPDVYDKNKHLEKFSNMDAYEVKNGELVKLEDFLDDHLDLYNRSKSPQESLKKYKNYLKGEATKLEELDSYVYLSAMKDKIFEEAKKGYKNTYKKSESVTDYEKKSLAKVFEKKGGRKRRRTRRKRRTSRRKRRTSSRRKRRRTSRKRKTRRKRRRSSRKRKRRTSRRKRKTRRRA